MSTKRWTYYLIIITIILCIPLIAMQFTNEVEWKIMDFVLMGILLLVFFFLLEGILTYAKSEFWKIFLILVIFFALLLTWAELAVGIVN